MRMGLSRYQKFSKISSVLTRSLSLNNMTKISFVYFDVGGVMIQDFSDSPKWQNMMDVMGIPIESRAEFDKYYHTLDTKFCLGEHEDNYLPQMSAQFNLKLPDGFSMRG